ncbi:hypothetical protein [Kineococcus rubinsiae]|uniref:hypothetical protein n=1 Tax=Kineococcus rubinsiae TaxID=2609562 RepID=UPI001430F49D|nr:hypothetical protein [Kineococcus rubinsiae]NIZ90797.1 hypothetical protein [Kineococcus rubinsiae]
MSVVDLRGSAGGDAAGLGALAAALQTAARTAERAAEAAGPLAVDEAFAADARDIAAALRTAAGALLDAVDDVRHLAATSAGRDPAAADAVEATLAERLREPLGRLAGALTAR